MDETVILTLLLKELIDIIKKIINYVSDRKIGPTSYYIINDIKQ